MSGMMTGSQSTFTNPQIELLQKHIRLFKVLTKRYTDSDIPKSLPENMTANTIPVPNAIMQPNSGYMNSNMNMNGGSTMNGVPSTARPGPPLGNKLNANMQSSSIPMNNNLNKNIQQHPSSNMSSTMKGSKPTISQTSTQVAAPSVSNGSSNNYYPSSSQPATGTQSQSNLSWQCFNTILCGGPSRPLDGLISIAPENMGCFSKSAHLPLVVTTPFAAALREKALKLLLNDRIASGGNAADTSDKLIALQRHLRAQAIEIYAREASKPTKQKASKSSSNSLASLSNAGSVHPSFPLGPTGYLAELHPKKNFVRPKRTTRKDPRQIEREERRRKSEMEDKRKRRNNELLRVLMTHRDDFVKFHKNKRQDQGRLARNIRQYVEQMESRREKDEAKSEAKRLQALRENDMESYMKLVSETKNQRLQYLLNETDSYIATINRMIEEQRDQNNLSFAPPPGTNYPVKSEDTYDGINTSATKAYMSSTHRVAETVSQPVMLRGGDLKEYQLGGLQWLVSLYNNNLNGILADEMGLGKTIQTIALLAYVMEVKHNNGPFMIVCPLSTLSNWVNECNKWAPDMIKVVFKGVPSQRKQIFKDEVESGHFNVLLTTYEYVMKDKGMLSKLYWQYVIVDEGHRMKNSHSKFAQTLGQKYQSRHRILLTGTPLQNNLPELWSLLNFLLPTIFSSVDTFDQWFNKPFAAFRQQASAASGSNDDGVATGEPILNQEEQMLIIHRLHEVLRPFVLRRVKAQVLDQLPEKVEKVLRCDFSGWQRKLYKAIYAKSLAGKDVKDVFALGADGNSGGINNVWMQLRKVCNHPYLFLNDYIVDDDIIRSSGKFELLDRMLPKLRAAGHRLLIFSQMTLLMSILEQFFALKGYNYLRLDGNTSSEEREKRMYEFNDPNSPYFIFLLSTRAGGLGLNLATADTVIIFDSDWNPMMDAQAQDRAHRIGQKNEVRVFRLITNSMIEEKILARATDKKNLNGLVVEAGKFNQQQPAGTAAVRVRPNSAYADKEDVGDGDEDDSRQMMEDLLNEWKSGGAVPAQSGGGAEDGDEWNEQGLSGVAETDVPDDDQINDMMAVYDGELQLYQEMDRERLRRQQEEWVEKNRRKGVTGLAVPPMPARLMDASESPPWVNLSYWQARYQAIAAIMHADPSAIAKGKKGNKRKREIDDDGAEEDDDDFEDESTQEATTIGGKLMRKRRDVQYDDGMTDMQFSRMLERQADEAEQDLAVQQQQNKKQQGLQPLRLTAQQKLEKLPDDIVQSFLQIIQEISKLLKPDGTSLASLFREKPDKKLYRDYYHVISNPISLKEISFKLKNSYYTVCEEIENDLALMSQNALIFNGLSAVYEDCEVLRKEFYTRYAELKLQHGIEPAIDFVTDAFGNAQVYVPPLPPRSAAGQQTEFVIYDSDTIERLKAKCVEERQIQEEEDESPAPRKRKSSALGKKPRGRKPKKSKEEATNGKNNRNESNDAENDEENEDESYGAFKSKRGRKAKAQAKERIAISAGVTVTENHLSNSSSEESSDDEENDDENESNGRGEVEDEETATTLFLSLPRRKSGKMNGSSSRQSLSSMSTDGNKESLRISAGGRRITLSAVNK